MWYISGKHKSFHFQIKLRIESNWSRKSGQLAPEWMTFILAFLVIAFTALRVLIGRNSDQRLAPADCLLQ